MNSVTVPFPPSVNHAFRNVPGKGRVRTKKYERWLQDSGWCLAVSADTQKKVKGPVRVQMVFGRPDKRRRDLDNLIKASLDLLVRHNLIEDDSLVTELSAKWDETGEVTGALIEWEAAKSGGQVVHG